MSRAASPPMDNSLALRQAELAAAREAETRQAEKERLRKEELAGLRSSAAGSAKQRATDYFAEQGLDPEQYSPAISRRIDNILMGIAPEDPNPGAYFSNAGEDIFGAEQTAARGKAGRLVDETFAPNFETQRIADTFDDPYLDSIFNEERSEADAIIENMFNRGVLTATGRTGARADLDRQGSGARTKLNEIGTGVLSSGRDALRGVSDKARSAAQTLNLGSLFDPNQYRSEADASFDSFLGSINDQIRSRVPGDLFQTGGLAAIGGAAQGAQNTKFNPKALSGVTDEDEEETEETPAGIF
jgi:hypothetical protein